MQDRVSKPDSQRIIESSDSDIRDFIARDSDLGTERMSQEEVASEAQCNSGDEMEEAQEDKFKSDGSDSPPQNFRKNESFECMYGPFQWHGRLEGHTPSSDAFQRTWVSGARC